VYATVALYAAIKFHAQFVIVITVFAVQNVALFLVNVVQNV
jgi:hypothetical protein